jgi:DNA-directed RNA polymerase subunit N (RpoN/RPB10)
MGDVGPVRCTNCGRSIGNMYDYFESKAQELLGDKDRMIYNHEVELGPILNEMKVGKCCRSIFISFLPAYCIPNLY